MTRVTPHRLGVPGVWPRVRPPECARPETVTTFSTGFSRARLSARRPDSLTVNSEDGREQSKEKSGQADQP